MLLNFLRSAVTTGLLLLSAATANAYSTTMSSNYGGGPLEVGETVTVTVRLAVETSMASLAKALSV